MSSVAELRPIGAYMRTDADGYLLNECSASHVDPRLIALVTQFYRDSYGAALVAVYVRGSVARGSAVDGVSDLDTFAVVEDGHADACPLLPEAQQARLRAIAPGLVDYEFHACARSAVTGSYYSPWAFLVRTQSVCIHGTDLAPALAPYRVGPELMAEAIYLPQRMALYRQRLAREHTHEQRAATCQWMMKSLVRAAFDLTLEPGGRYTRDLYPCYSAFAGRYPQHESDCLRALRWAISPDGDSQAHSALAERLSAWIGGELARLAARYRLDMSNYAF